MIQTAPALIVPIRVDDYGVIRVANTRVTLDVVVYAFRDGATPEMIIEMFPTLTLPDVYSVTAYYLQNRVEVDAYLVDQEIKAEKIRERVEKDFPAEGLRERLLAKLREKRGT